MKQSFQQIVNEDLTDLMPNVTQPCLLIWGEDDTETPVADAQVFAKSLPHAKLEIIKNTGHYAFMDAPEKVEKLITEFLK
jgi:pimeloyl-ACP methyl ester carboxylesterase